MEKRFQKNSREMLMFREYYELVQKYWIVEEGDDYWDPFIADAIRFERSFQDIPLARNLVNAFANTQERSNRDGNTI